jgi:hypothetical protein
MANGALEDFSREVAYQAINPDVAQVTGDGMLTAGIPSLDIGNPYGLSFWSPFQSTLSSMYFPSYLYRPLYLGWPSVRRPYPGRTFIPSPVGFTSRNISAAANRSSENSRAQSSSGRSSSCHSYFSSYTSARQRSPLKNDSEPILGYWDGV